MFLLSPYDSDILGPLGLGSMIVFLMFEVYNILTVQFAIPSVGDNSKMIMVKS